MIDLSYALAVGIGIFFGTLGTAFVILWPGFRRIRSLEGLADDYQIGGAIVAEVDAIVRSIGGIPGGERGIRLVVLGLLDAALAVGSDPVMVARSFATLTFSQRAGRSPLVPKWKNPVRRNPKSGRMRPIISILIVLLGAGAGVARGHDPGPISYPKLAVYSRHLNENPADYAWRVSRFDLLLTNDRPEALRAYRRFNPDLRILLSIMPQFVRTWDGDESVFWYALGDTAWSIDRLAQVYAHRNPGWFLRTVSGDLIMESPGRAVINWTPLCPRGVYGTSRGLTFSEWYCKQLIRLSRSGDFWTSWDWDAIGNGYNGLIFEILADHLEVYGLPLDDVDLDGDGRSDSARLPLLTAIESRKFGRLLWEGLPPEMVVLINDNKDWFGPTWYQRCSGMKLENFMSQNTTWADWFYGKDGRGYLWAERSMGRTSEDRLQGWDLSIIRTVEDPRAGDAENRRRVRYGLATAMLGDGFYTHDLNEVVPIYRPEMGINLGSPVSDFWRIEVSTGTVFARRFERGIVLLNPGDRQSLGIPPLDAIFYGYNAAGNPMTPALGEAR